MNSDRLRFWLWAGAALVAGLLLRLWFVDHMARVVGDSLVYGDLAKTWLQHGFYGFVENGRTPGSVELRPTLIRLPGYPLFLAACFRIFGMENYRAVLLVQVAADLVSCCLASALAGRLFGRRAGLPVLWIAALCPFTANYASVALAETLVFTTIALALYAFARWQDAGLGYSRWLWVIAASLAYSILLRPEQGLLAAAIMPPMLWVALKNRERHSWLRAALPVMAAALCVLLPLVPWTIRNEHIFHVFQPLAPRDANDPGEPNLPGFGRWYRAWAIDFASVDAIGWPMDGEPIAFDALPERAFAVGTPAATEELRRRTAAVFADYNATLTLTPEIDARFDAIAMELIRAHPVRYYFGLHIARLLDMALRPRTETMPVSDEWWRWGENRRQTTFSVAYAALNLAYFGFGFAGFSVWRRHAWLSADTSGSGRHAYRELAVAMAASILWRAILLLFIDNSEPRYTLEFFPVFFVWIGALFAAPVQPPQIGHAAVDLRG